MKNKLMAVILVSLVLLTSGCGTSDYIQDEDGNVVKYEVTGQSLQKNILCKPEEDSELYALYAEYDDELDISLSELPSCDEFTITSNESSGLWELIFVKPLAWLILKVGSLVNNMGLSVIIIGLLIRLILLPFSYKTQKQSKNMQKAQNDLQKLEVKYRGRDDKDSAMMKSQEMMAIYKKYDIKPMSGCLLAFIQLPVFFAFLQAINRVPAIFEDTLFGLNLGMTPYVGLSNGNYWYLLLVILIGITTYFSFRYSMRSANTSQTPDMQKQMSTMTIIMVILIVMTSFSLSTAIAFYWITTYAFIALQTYLFKKLLSKDNGSKNKKAKKEKNKKPKIKDKLEAKEKMKYGK